MKTKNIINYALLGVSAIVALLAGIFFNVVSTTGYLAGNPYNVGVTVLCVLGAVIICGSSLSKVIGMKISMLLQVIAAIMLAFAFVLMLMDKANFIGDSFIPMERTASFHNGIAMTYVSLVFLGVSELVLAANAFLGNPEKAA